MQAVEVAEGGDVDPVLAGDFEDGLIGAGAAVLAINFQRYDL